MPYSLNKYKFNIFLIFIFVEQYGETTTNIEKTTVAESGNALILISLYAGKLGVIVPGGKYYIKCNNLIDALKTAFMCFYVLHYKYVIPQKCLDGILDWFS